MEPEGKKLFETGILGAVLGDADEVKMDAQNGSG